MIHGIKSLDHDRRQKRALKWILLFTIFEGSLGQRGSLLATFFTIFIKLLLIAPPKTSCQILWWWERPWFYNDITDLFNVKNISCKFYIKEYWEMKNYY